MEKELRSSFYGKSKNVDNGHGRGTFDLGGNQAMCNGDLNFCDKPSRFSTSQSEQKGNGKERRKHPRVVLDLPLECRVTNIPNVYGALVANGSETGLLVESVKNIPVGTNLNVVVLFPKGYELADFELSAQIVWKEPCWKEDWEGYQYGLKFVSIRAHDQWKLRQLLNGGFNFDEPSPDCQEKALLR